MTSNEHRRQRLRRPQRRGRRHAPTRRARSRPRTTGGACGRRSAAPSRRRPTTGRRSRRRRTRRTRRTRSTAAGRGRRLDDGRLPARSATGRRATRIHGPVPGRRRRRCRSNDAAPAITLTPERAQYRRGETVKLTATASDDFGIREVTFFDGAHGARHATTPAVRDGVHAARRRAVRRARSLAATAEDSLGQTAAATVGHRRSCATRRRRSQNPPTVELPDNLTTIPRGGDDRDGRAGGRAGDRVGRVLPRDAPRLHVTSPRPTVPDPPALRRRSARRPCAWSSPTPPALTGQDSRQVDRAAVRAARHCSIEVKRERLPRNRVRRTVTATVVPPAGIARVRLLRRPRSGGGHARGARRSSTARSSSTGGCRATVLRLTTRRSSSAQLRYKVSVRFGGTSVLAPVRETRRFSLMPSLTMTLARATALGIAVAALLAVLSPARGLAAVDPAGCTDSIAVRPGDPEVRRRRRAPAGRGPDGQHRPQPHRGHLRVLRRGGRRTADVLPRADAGKPFGTSVLGRPLQLLRSGHAGQHRQPRLGPQRRPVLGGRAVTARCPRPPASRRSSTRPGAGWITATPHGAEPAAGEAIARNLYELAARTDCWNARRLQRHGPLPAAGPQPGRARRDPGGAHARGRSTTTATSARRTRSRTARSCRCSSSTRASSTSTPTRRATGYFFPPNEDPVHHEISDFIARLHRRPDRAGDPPDVQRPEHRLLQLQHLRPVRARVRGHRAVAALAAPPA